MVLIGELVFVYLTNDKVLIDGFIHKEELLFGWTVNNPFGFHLTILIPPLMRGAMKIKRLSLFYFLASVLVWAGAILTLSRNAWIFSTLSFAACLIIACFCSETKWLFRSLTLIAVIIGIFGIIIFKDKLTEIFARVIKAGLNDNGRYNLWRQSFQNLKEAPVFGYGFYGFGENDVYVTVDFLPTMAHNTVFQLISAMGAVGLLSYAYYRISTLVPLFKKFSYEKLMLYIAVFVTLGASLLDNFIFYFIDAFHYALSLAIIFKLHREAKENDGPLKSI
jgi:O-antigen ligase